MADNKKYKVLLIGPSSVHVANHYDRISNAEFDIQIITDKLGHLPAGTDFTQASFSLRSIGPFFRTPKLIRQKIQSFQPDVIHVHQANSVAFYAVRGAKGLNVPLVLSVWGSDVLINPEKSRWMKWMVRYILKRADLFTSNSHFMAEKIQGLLPERKLDIEICNFGVPELDIEIQKEKIVYSNRAHTKLYRVSEVIRAFHWFVEQASDGEDWKLVVAGKGAETEHLKQQAEALGINDQVEFIGFVDTATNIANYARAKVYVSLPISDAAAVSLLESMYYRCIPVAYDLPASREHIRGGENGILVTDLNSNMIAEALTLDNDAVLTENHEHVKREQTVAVSRVRFREVLYKAINLRK